MGHKLVRIESYRRGDEDADDAPPIAQSRDEGGAGRQGGDEGRLHGEEQSNVGLIQPEVLQEQRGEPSLRGKPREEPEIQPAGPHPRPEY